jgi:hypothetical protein
MNNEITIFLTEEEATKFVLFQKHYSDFMLMIEKGVFDQKNATIMLDYDSNGVLQTIRRNDFMYSKKYSQ